MKKPYLKNIAAGIALSCLAGGALAGGAFDLSIKSDMVRIEHEAVLVGSGALFTVGGLFTQSDASMFSVGFNGVDTSSQNVEWNGGLGVKGFLWNVSDSYLSLAVGGFARYAPATMNGLGFEGSFYMSPSILSFGDADSFQEMVLRVNYKIMPQGRVFVGYNNASGTLKSGGRQSINQGMHLGFRFKY
jgi:hypothetical protein